MKYVVKQINNDGYIMAYKVTDDNDQELFVPDAPANRHRQEIDQFVADGGTITEEEI